MSNDRTGTMSIRDSTLEDNPNDGFHTPGVPGIYFLGARRCCEEERQHQAAHESTPNQHGSISITSRASPRASEAPLAADRNRA